MSAATIGFTGLVSLLAQVVAILAGLVFVVVVVINWREWADWLRKVRAEGRMLVLIGMIISAIAFATFFALWHKGTESEQSSPDSPMPQEGPAQAAPAIPDRSEITPLVSIDGVEGEDLVGSILLRNGSNRAVTLLAYRYDTFGGLIQTGEVPQTIPAYQTFPIPLEFGNRLVKTGSLSIRYDFKFLGDEQTHKGEARFVVPEAPRAGTQFGPTECCDAGDAPLLGNGAQTIHDELRQPKGHLGFVVRDEEGVQNFGALPFQLIRFNPATRIVLFLSGPEGPRQIALTSGLARNPHGEHWIAVAWDVDKDHFAMSVDGRPARRQPLK